MTDVLLNRGNVAPETETDTGRTLHEDRRKDQGDASTSQRTPKTVRHQHKPREAWDRPFPSQPSGGTNPAGTLRSDVQPAELRHNKWLLLKLSCLGCSVTARPYAH